MKYLRTWLWSIAYDPHFVAAKKNRKVGQTAIQKVDDALGHEPAPMTSLGAVENYMDHALQLQAEHLAWMDAKEALSISACEPLAASWEDPILSELNLKGFSTGAADVRHVRFSHAP